ncbi:MAG: Trk family potassium uptake protein, partial [Gammaproteobacteria bacterium]|nr:Trk family potassium uptake protein [Gammaproteobacteria bacterium]
MKKVLSPVRFLSIGYIFTIMVGTILLLFPDASRNGYTSFLDALFTATSATCVTGLVPFDTFEHWTLFGQIVILVLIQIGGLGFMTIITLFFML